MVSEGDDYVIASGRNEDVVFSVWHSGAQFEITVKEL